MKLSTRRGIYVVKTWFFILTNASFSCSSAQDTLECLRAVDINSLQNVNIDISNSGFFGTFVFVPVVDGNFITDRPTELLKAGKVNGVRWLHLLPSIHDNNWHCIGDFAFSHQCIRRHHICRSEYSIYGPSS